MPGFFSGFFSFFLPFFAFGAGFSASWAPATLTEPSDAKVPDSTRIRIRSPLGGKISNKKVVIHASEPTSIADILSDLAAATTAWQQTNGAYNFATLTGDLLSRHGVFTGGSLNGAANGKAPSSILGRKNQITGLKAEVEQLKSTQAQLVKRLGGAPTQAWASFEAVPRYHNNYVGLRNRFALLSEAYAYATFKDRITATRYFVEEALNYASANADKLKKACAAAA